MAEFERQPFPAGPEYYPHRRAWCYRPSSNPNGDTLQPKTPTANHHQISPVSAFLSSLVIWTGPGHRQSLPTTRESVEPAHSDPFANGDCRGRQSRVMARAVVNAAFDVLVGLSDRYILRKWAVSDKYEWDDIAALVLCKLFPPPSSMVVVELCVYRSLVLGLKGRIARLNTASTRWNAPQVVSYRQADSPVPVLMGPQGSGFCLFTRALI